MLNDALANFVQPGAPLSIVGGLGVGFASNVYDEIGAGVGTPPGNIIGTRTLFGADYGIGVKRPQIDVAVGTAFATSDAATLNVQFQGAVDTGTPTYQPGAWLTLMETGPISAANLTAQQIIARFDFMPAFPPGTLPRYLRLFFSVLTGTQFTAGTIAFAIVVMDRDDQANRYAAKNFVVA
jgi:hypothetical protein